MKILKPPRFLDHYAQPLATNVPDDYPAYSASTTYSIGQKVTCVTDESFTLYTEYVFESLVNSNVGNSPASSPTKWLNLGVSNKTAMHDMLVSTQTISPANNPGVIDVTMQPYGNIDAMALINMQATSVRIVMKIDTTTVFDKTIDMLDNVSTTDWYAYFYNDITYKTDLIISDLPRYNARPTVQIIITHVNDYAKCGHVVFGNIEDIGDTQFNPTIGIVDYSVKSTDTFGNTTLLQRKFSKRMAAKLEVPSHRVDEIFNLFAAYRSTPLVWIGADNDYQSMIIWGFYKDFEIDVAYPKLSYCTLTIEGLT